MKRILNLLLLALVAVPSVSQPKLTSRAINSYPTALPLTEDDIEWQRDIYREINISENENAGLFYCDLGDETQEALFPIIFHLALSGDIPAYRYALDGNEVFNAASMIQVRDLLDDFHIPYAMVAGKPNVKDEDLPSSEVTCYYVKEGVYYDLTNSAFRRRVLAICPVIVSVDEFGEGETKYPLFWVRYIDLEPFLKGKRIIPDSRNKAAIMNMTDYFTLNRYRGPIYKINNAQGLSLAQYCEEDSLIVKEQMRIEAELKKVQRQTYNTFKPTPKPVPEKKKKKTRKRFSLFGLSIGIDKKSDATDDNKD